MNDEISSIQAAKRAREAEQAAEAAVVQESSEEELEEWSEVGASFNPRQMGRAFETLEERLKKATKQESSKAEKKEELIKAAKEAEEAAERYQSKNPELSAKALLALRGRITPQDSREEMLKKIQEFYPDISLSDEAIDYLIETSKGEMNAALRTLKEEITTRYGREIIAGRNIASQAREFSEKGLGSTNALRDIYREITGNPKEPSELFDQLSTTFTFDKMKTLIDFLHHALGSDLRSKGPSIASGELFRLMTESRTLASILQVYRFFRSRMKLIHDAFEDKELPYPPKVTFEFLAKLFVKFLLDRYPSSDKVLQMAIEMGIPQEIVSQVICFTQMRDGVRQVAPKLYRSEQHRQDVLSSYIGAIEELDEKLEEEDNEK